MQIGNRIVYESQAYGTTTNHSTIQTKPFFCLIMHPNNQQVLPKKNQKLYGFWLIKKFKNKPPVRKNCSPIINLFKENNIIIIY